MKSDEELEGLHGWLILVGLGVFLSPIRLIISCYSDYKPIFDEGVWSALTSPESEAYHPWWASFLIGEISANLVIVLASLYLIYLYLSKSYLFPRLFIAIVVASLILISLDAWILKGILPNEPMFDPAAMKEFARSLFTGLIWIPYMLISKRVKNTFTKGKLQEQSQPRAIT